MTRAERARRIMAILDDKFPAPAIPLDHGDAFQLLVAVVLSAQCTDERVNQVTPALFARAGDPAAMSALTPAQIKPYIQSCGLAPAKSNGSPGASATFTMRSRRPFLASSRAR